MVIMLLLLVQVLIVELFWMRYNGGMPLDRRSTTPCRTSFQTRLSTFDTILSAVLDCSRLSLWRPARGRVFSLDKGHCPMLFLYRGFLWFRRVQDSVWTDNMWQACIGLTSCFERGGLLLLTAACDDWELLLFFVRCPSSLVCWKLVYYFNFVFAFGVYVRGVWKWRSIG